MVHHSNDDAMNKIPLKSSSGLDDEEKNGGELMQDTAAAEEARREQMRANVLAWMKKLTIGLICFIGIALISYVIISLCFSDWPKSTPLRNSSNSSSVATSTLATTAATGDAATSPPAAAAAAAAEVAATTELAAADPAPLQSPEMAAATSAETFATSATTRTTSTTTTTTTESTPTATTTTTTTTPIATTTSPTATATTSTSNTLIPFIPSTDEQPLDASPTSNDNNNSIEATTLASGENIMMAGPAVAASTLATTPPTAATKATSNAEQVNKLGVYQHAAVCSDAPVCSQVGSDILARNGSAVDATIAIMLCNGLLTSQSMGIGGGLLMNIYDRASREGYQIDAHLLSPYDVDVDMFDKVANESLYGPLSIAVPGEVMGYHLAYERFGKLPWRDLVAPSLKICETGYHMTRHQENSVRFKWDSIKHIPHYRDLFLNPETGNHYTAGAFIKAPKQLCKTYQLLADNGPMDFYNGTISELLAEDLKELNSSITHGDLEAYSAELRLSITMPLANGTLYVVPPVSSGSVVAHVLSILDGFNLTRSDLRDDESYALTVHRIVEAIKFGFAQRTELGDPRFVDVRELISQLNNPDFAADKRLKINDTHVLSGPQEYGAQLSYEADDHGTSHIAVLAPNGDAVSVTSSINMYYGSNLIGPRTGIILNNGMNDFAVSHNFFELPPSPANTIGLHKRPMSSQSPLLLTDHEGNIRLAIGAAGGSKIIPAIVEVAARYLWFGEDLKEAIDVPRFYHQLMPDELTFEKGALSESVQQLLAKRGHKLKQLKEPYGSVVCAIGRNATAIYANADYRKQGGVAGF